MFDFSVRLRDNARLLTLLSHYAQAGAADRAAWQDRLMEMDGVEPRELTALHGELIAFDWIEQNTGHVIVRPGSALAACYRVTQHGMREFRRISGLEPVEDQPEVAEKPQPKFPRKKKEKPEVPATVPRSRAGAVARHGAASASDELSPPEVVSR
ncbi:hypothetical protein J0H58_12690 [bacterium]|nr:hypothetical protein [bacterium]